MINEKPVVVKHKLVLSGNIVEQYKYSNGYIKGHTRTDGQNGTLGGRTVEKSINYHENRKKSGQRAQRVLKRLINANHNQYSHHTTKFVTLTFREDIKLEKAVIKLTNFIRRLNYHIFKVKKAVLAYIAVPEFTKKGRPHFHLVVFNMPFTKADTLADIWTYGFVKINRCDDVTNLGAYVCKYLTKETDSRLEGKKRYYCSRGLYQPENLINEKADILAKCLPEDMKTYEAFFENEYAGGILYKQYNITDKNDTKR